MKAILVFILIIMKRYITTILTVIIAVICQAQNVELAVTCKGVTEQVITHVGYTASYNQDWLIPNWVAWELTREEAYGATRRAEQFVPDPSVRGRSATTYDYSYSGYDRGHMAPAADMKWSEQAMNESFYLTNVCPQHHDINAGQWEEVERRCRGWAKFHGKVWICCGPIVRKQPKTIGENKVVVPSGFFKVVCVERKGRYNAIGFVFPNGPCEGSMWDYAMTVDLVEDLTGHDFFCILPDNIENEMEKSWNEKFWKSN